MTTTFMERQRIAWDNRSPSEPEIELPAWCIGDGITMRMVDDACMNHGHDFGLCNGREKNNRRRVAMSWLYAWRKAME